MKRIVIAGVAIAVVLVLAVAGSRRLVERLLDREIEPAVVETSTGASSIGGSASEVDRAFLYGRVTARNGAVYEGRLRWGGREEALWGQFFNGTKKGNPWEAYASSKLTATEGRPIEIFGFRIAGREHQIDSSRPFMARFGDIERVEADTRSDLRVTLKSGTVFELERFAADDFADGLRVWDPRRGVVDLGERSIRSIELLPSSGREGDVKPLHGTVKTRHAEFTGWIQWNRMESLGTDTLDGRSAEGELNLRFDSVRSIERHSRDSSLVTLTDGREVELFGREVGTGNRGVYVDDQRYGRVLVSWAAIERAELGPGGSAPAYVDFPPGALLTGGVTLRSGRRVTGRLVFDLDESETTETLDAPFQGVNYTIPFGMVASVRLPGAGERRAQLARVSLHNGEELELERSGDLGERNAGMLIFLDEEEAAEDGAAEGDEITEHVPWSDVERIDFDPPSVDGSPY